MRAAIITRYILTISVRFPSCFGRVLIVAALISSVAGCGNEPHQQLQRHVPTALPTEGILFEIQLAREVDCGVIQIDVTGNVYRYPCGTTLTDTREHDLHIPGFADTSFDWLHDSTERNGEGGILLDRISDSLLLYMYEKALKAEGEVLPPLVPIRWSLHLRAAAFTLASESDALNEVLLVYSSGGLYQRRRGNEADEIVSWLLHLERYYESNP